MIGLFVVGGMAFGLALSYYKNTLFDQQLISMQDHNDQLKEQIDKGYGDLEYYNSLQYKDKYAKENMGLVNNTEKVLIITHATQPVVYNKSEELTPEQKQAIYEENLRNISTIDHWMLYLFHHEKIDDLKGRA